MSIESIATGDLGNRAYRAAMFLSTGRIALLVVTTGQKIFLARILAPDQFGILGICLLVIALAETLTETGLMSALMHEQSIDELALDSLWTVLVLRGVLLAGLTVALADPIANRFFSEPRAVAPLQCLALVFILNGLVNSRLVLLRRDIRFAPLVFLQFAEAAADLVFAIVFALTLRNVWALVIAILAAKTVRVVLSYVLWPSRPRLHLDTAMIARLSRYSRWISANTLLAFLINTVDNFTVGRILGAQQLGFYQAAFDFSNLTSTSITNAVHEVSFPTYVKVRDHGQIGSAYLEVLRTVVFVSVPITGSIFLLAPAGVRVVLGSAWEPMVPTLQILAFVGMIRSIAANSGALYSALGRPDIATQQAALRLVLTVATVIPFTRLWGIEGTAASVLLGGLLVAPTTYARSIQLSRCGVRPFLQAISVPIFNTMVMIAVVLAVRWWREPPQNIPSLVVDAMLGAFIYGFKTVIWVNLLHYPLPHLPLSLADFTGRFQAAAGVKRARSD